MRSASLSEAGARREPLAQRAARDVRLDVVQQTTGFAGVDQRHDVRVLQAAPRFRSRAGCSVPSAAVISGRSTLIATLRPCFFSREIDGGHAAAAQLTLDGVAIGECGGDGRGLRPGGDTEPS